MEKSLVIKLSKNEVEEAIEEYLSKRDVAYNIEKFNFDCINSNFIGVQIIADIQKDN